MEPKDEIDRETGAKLVSFEKLLRKSDFISIHVPLTPDTHGMIGKRELQMMRETAILINTSRGNIVIENDLFNALESGILAGAGIDVFDKEPISPSSPLINLQNVVLTPHIASASVETRNLMASMTANNILDFFKGEVPQNLVNREVLDL